MDKQMISKSTASILTRAAITLMLCGQIVHAWDNGMARTPAMGWNTWNKFGCAINEDLIKATADQIVNLGLDKVGFQYVNIDDCWMTSERGEDGHIQVDYQAFPSGMKALGDYIHSKGLKYGLYSSGGTHSCQYRTGSMGYEEVDAKDLISWGVDYVKYDNCNHGGAPNKPRFQKMRDALNATGKPIVYSICNWGDEKAWEWGPVTGHSWRTTQDIADKWVSVEYNFYENQKYAEHAGPGHWNDADMLEVGNGGMTITEEKTHFALWCIAKSPLIMGNDLVNIRPESLEILKNVEVIGINQDPLGKQGVCKVNCDLINSALRKPQVIAAPMSNGDVAAVIVNWRELNYGEFEFGVNDIDFKMQKGETYEVRDLWAHKTLGPFSNPLFKVDSIPGHGNHALRFIKKAKATIQ